ncbi:HAMP domain-containing sensor histidine kinase [Paenibacillus sp. UMB7766-LJ446]|uniref:sensor histidine kinase n=1 Tax=Paenibacillus sp. UMB7766-LJ446 TaxID=3046313 RepID=UPI00254A58F8|nr:HAMP domain-containing sensor histidine kinase [Paenibacillus sp. UMB7766-LJ446]MDK8189586.1 HAMP domain-containing sensor histidine kinase [Paenibacillus sp. UMB7766-LJ446]
MKLVHQINLAFGLSLVLILSVTAVLLHYVLLDHFIGTEKNDLKTLSVAMSASITEAGDFAMSPVLSTGDVTLPNSNNTGMQSVQLVTGEVASAPTTLIPADVEAFVTDFNGNVLSGTTLSVNGITGKVSSDTLTEAVPANLQQYTAVTSSSIKDLWSGTDGRYVMDVSPIPQGTLTLLTPMSKIKAIEQALLGRLILVIVIVGAMMFLLSLFITKRLIQPLMNLKQELKKVKERHFTDVQLVRAGGEIGAVAQTVYEMAGELNRFNEVQKQFFQNASHELKTPLMSIAGYAEGIRDGIFEGDNVRKGLDVILGESSRLGKIVTEMTLLAKLDSEEDIFKSSEVSLNELLTETSERVNPLLVKKGLTLHITCPENQELFIMADQDKLLQALLNVVTNAARYAKKEIRINASLEKGKIALSVSDDGPGFPQELLPTLFHRFVKGKDGESGLGLAIARAIVERCGGLIQATNRKEGGAVISFGFPSAQRV